MHNMDQWIRRALALTLLARLTPQVGAATATTAAYTGLRHAAAQTATQAAPESPPVDDRSLIAQRKPEHDHPTDHTAQAGATKPLVRTVAVDYTAPPGQDVSGMVIVLRYPAEKVSLPGTGADASVRTRVDSTPAGATVAVYDREDVLRVVIARSTPIASGQLFRVDFDRRPGAPPLAAADFGCTVEGCASVLGMVEGCSCTVISP